ncbi:hypothetical protein Bbelb_114080 [Branchiostoma belcheri]|nr:hypothetical protein Bbelb_114080 [Branchiostoma belcheri]
MQNLTLSQVDVIPQTSDTGGRGRITPPKHCVYKTMVTQDGRKARIYQTRAEGACAEDFLLTRSKVKEFSGALGEDVGWYGGHVHGAEVRALTSNDATARVFCNVPR